MAQSTPFDAETRRRIQIWFAVIVAFFVFLFLIKSILLPFVVGMGVAYFLDPAADRLEEWGFSRLAATVTITAMFFLSALILLLILAPVVVEQFAGLADALPEYIASFEATYGQTLQEWSARLGYGEITSAKQAISSASGTALKFVGDLVGGIFQSGLAMVNLLSLLFITPVVAFYLLRDWDRIVEKLDTLLPREHAETIRQQVRRIDQTLSGFVRGQTNVCLLLGTFYAVALSLVGLKFAIIIGLLAGVLTIIPYVGSMFGLLLSIGVAWFQFENTADVLIVAAIFIAGQVAEGNFITPKLVGDKVGLHALWIIFGMLAGAALFGFVGVLLAVPITAIIGVLARFAVERYLESSLYNPDKNAQKS